MIYHLSSSIISDVVLPFRQPWLKYIPCCLKADWGSRGRTLRGVRSSFLKTPQWGQVPACPLGPWWSLIEVTDTLHLDIRFWHYTVGNIWRNHSVVPSEVNRSFTPRSGTHTGAKRLAGNHKAETSLAATATDDAISFIIFLTHWLSRSQARLGKRIT